MPDIQGFIYDLISRFWLNATVIIAGFIFLAMALGSLKSIAGRLFMFFLRTGDQAATATMERPKGLVLLAAALFLVAPSVALGYLLMPPKTVEKTVYRTVTVSDNTEIERLKRVIGEMEVGVLQAKHDAELARAEQQEALRRMQEAQAAVAVLQRKVKLQDPDEVETLRAAWHKAIEPLDRPHIQQVQFERDRLIHKGLKTKGVFREATHPSYVSHVTYFHWRCSICQKNMAIMGEGDKAFWKFVAAKKSWESLRQELQAEVQDRQDLREQASEAGSFR